jgi:hypothetical protein
MDRLDYVLLKVNSSGLEFGFEEEQLSFQLEGLIFEFKEAIDKAISLTQLGD